MSNIFIVGWDSYKLVPKNHNDENDCFLWLWRESATQVFTSFTLGPALLRGDGVIKFQAKKIKFQGIVIPPKGGIQASQRRDLPRRESAVFGLRDLVTLNVPLCPGVFLKIRPLILL